MATSAAGNPQCRISTTGRHWPPGDRTSDIRLDNDVPLVEEVSVTLYRKQPTAQLCQTARELAVLVWTRLP